MTVGKHPGNSVLLTEEPASKQGKSAMSLVMMPDWTTLHVYERLLMQANWG
jgi:hypothetical protein